MLSRSQSVSQEGKLKRCSEPQCRVGRETSARLPFFTTDRVPGSCRSCWWFLFCPPTYCLAELQKNSQALGRMKPWLSLRHPSLCLEIPLSGGMIAQLQSVCHCTVGCRSHHLQPHSGSPLLSAGGRGEHLCIKALQINKSELILCRRQPQVPSRHV